MAACTPGLADAGGAGEKRGGYLGPHRAAQGGREDPRGGAAKVRVQGRVGVPVSGFAAAKSGDGLNGLGRDAAATYTLRYNMMPHVGALVYGTAGSTNGSVAFPPMINHS